MHQAEESNQTSLEKSGSDMPARITEPYATRTISRAHFTHDKNIAPPKIILIASSFAATMQQRQQRQAQAPTACSTQIDWIQFFWFLPPRGGGVGENCCPVYEREKFTCIF